MSPEEQSISWADPIDLDFIRAVQVEVTQSCALPLAVPIERIPALIVQAARFFWQNDDLSSFNRIYMIPYSEFCHQNVFNKIVKLPPQIISVQGCYRTNVRTGVLGDFSLERMMLSSYSLFAGWGAQGNGTPGFNYGATIGGAGYALTEVVANLYEISTYEQVLCPTLTYDYNPFSNVLTVLGDMKHSNILIDVWQRVKIQDLYKNYYFFRFVVCLVKRALYTIYGTFEFKLPGGVTINYDHFKEEADSEIDEIKEWIDKNHSSNFFFMPNTL